MMYRGGGGASTSGGGGVNSHRRNGFTVDEMDVSEILLSLRHLIHSSESRYRFSVQWGTRKKRSVIESDPSPTPNRLLLPSPERPKKKVQASSPATPLSYLPSESDDRAKDPVKKISKRKTREELKDAVDELEKERRSLKRKLETERSRRHQLMAYNTVLKAKQIELNTGFKSPVIETTTVTEEKQEERNSWTHDHHKIHRNGLVWPSFVGPLPDLNLTVDDVPQKFDLRDFRVKSAAAEARRRRMLRMKEKMKKSSLAVKVSTRC